MSERKRLSINPLWPAAVLVAAFGLAAAACSGEPEAVGRCDLVTCEEPLQCDPGDGQCKCGGEGGVICGPGGTCTGTGCTYACGEVTCAGGSTLDPLDCTCKCGGQGGVACADGERCDTMLRRCYAPPLCDGVVCAAGMECDPKDGLCKCGGAVCEKFEACRAGACVADLCNGVTCTGGTVCSQVDGKCHCGGDAGTICAYGEVCGCPDGKSSCGAAEKRCQTNTACLGVQCAGGTTCDPQDGACRCGGPGGPVCQFGQSCDVLKKICLGADRCTGVVCGSGLTCDPETGLCKCGGLNGQLCAQGEICAVTSARAVCAKPCNPGPPATACPNTSGDRKQGCFYDIHSRLSYCMPYEQGALKKVEGTGCNFKADSEEYPCEPGLHCQQRIDEPGVCRYYCKPSVNVCPSSGGSQQECRDIENGPAGLMACDRLQ